MIIAVEQSTEQNSAYRHRNGGRFRKRGRPSAFSISRVMRLLPRVLPVDYKEMMTEADCNGALSALFKTGEVFLTADTGGPPAARLWRAHVVTWLRENFPDSELVLKAGAIPAPRYALNSATGRGLQPYDRNGVRRLLQILIEAKRLFEDEHAQFEKKETEMANAKESNSNKLVFISHSSGDADLSEALVDLLCSALHLRVEDFRCTSVAGAKLPGGAQTESVLRKEIREVPVFLSLLTAISLESHYVLFELGARWGIEKHHIPLLAKGVGAEVIKEPLKATNALRLAEEEDVLQLVHDIADTLKRAPVRTESYIKKVRALSKLAQATPVRTARSPKGKALAPTNAPGLRDPHRLDDASEKVLAELVGSSIFGLMPLELASSVGLHRLRVEQCLKALAAEELIVLGGGSNMASTATDLGKEYLLRYGIV